LISESHIGKHRIEIPDFEGELELLSLQGSRGINLFKGTYFVSKPIREYAKRFDLILIGTDLDFQGTKIASILYHNLFHPRVVRLSFTNHGYVRVGEVFSKSRIGKLLALEKENMRMASRLKRKFKVNGIGLQKALLLREVYSLYKEKKPIKVLRKKTSTITAMVQGGKLGFTPSQTMGILVDWYKAGLIEYPRTDVEYIFENPYNLYPHPPLPVGDSPLLQPIGERELEYSSINALLHLSNERLISPSSAVSAFETITRFFNKDLSPKTEFIPLLEYLYENLSQSDYTRFRTYMSDIYFPQLYLSEAFKLDGKTLEKLYFENVFVACNKAIKKVL